MTHNWQVLLCMKLNHTLEFRIIGVSGINGVDGIFAQNKQNWWTFFHFAYYFKVSQKQATKGSFKFTF